MKAKLLLLVSVLVLGMALTACGDGQETQAAVQAGVNAETPEAETIPIPEDAEFWDAPETAPIDIDPDPVPEEPVQETAAYTPETAPPVNP
ncbi:MAG: hypothetical protein IJ642_08145 [Oscillospiraceae bacterium]|nr:hypothetical protein [Oscillospiraceae bacterium]